jgi:hypothetical protein
VSDTLGRIAATIQAVTGAKPKRKPRRGSLVKVYVLKKNGRAISGNRAQQRARAVAALRMGRVGEGGGIAAVLLPTNDRDRRRMENDDFSYTLELVRPRVRWRCDLRDAARDPVLLLKLLSICPAKQGWTRRQFVAWLVSEIEKRESAARRILADIAPELLSAHRQIEWWYKALSPKRRVKR